MQQYVWMDRLLDSQKAIMTDKQINIIRTAIELFSAKGYHATTTKEIAQKTGVAEGTIFKHYATKKDLILSISDMIISNVAIPILTAGLDEVANQSYETLDEFFSSLMLNRLSIIKEGVPIIKILLQELPFQPEIRGLLLQNIEHLHMAEGLEQLKARKLIIDLPTVQLLKLIFTCFFGFLAIRYIFLPELFVDDSEEDIENFIHFMARGLAASAQD